LSIRILIGDVREQLRLLPADSFDCVVTSPPYWGLRDYGTGRWDGGDINCDHKKVTDEAFAVRKSTLGDGKKHTGHILEGFKEQCGRCGAKRIDRQIGMEPTVGDHLAVMVDVFAEVRRVMKPTATLWLNYGDCYATSPNGRSAADTKAAGDDDRTFRDKPFSTIGGVLKAKDLCMIPNRLAIALQEAGWWVRSEIIWHKPNPMPESIKDRPGSSHEKVWLLSKQPRYFYDHIAVRQPLAAASVSRLAQDVESQEGSTRANGGGKTNGNMKAVKFGGNKGGENPTHSGNEWDPTLEGSNLRNVWTIATAAFSEAHFATFPPELAERCIKAGCPPGGHVLDPFGGAGTTGLVADRLQRHATLIELNPEYAALARRRIDGDAPLFVGAAE
jgi:DNA modification methylase